MKKYLICICVMCMIVLSGCGAEITGIEFPENSAEMPKNGQMKLNYTLIPEEAKDKGIIWTSSDESIAEVDKNGNITAKETGEITITASTKKGVTAECEVTVKPVVESIEFGTDNINIKIGDTGTVSYTITPEDAYINGLVWSSSDESIATVNENGEITGNSIGTAIISVSEENGINSEFTVEVQQIFQYIKLFLDSLDEDSGNEFSDLGFYKNLSDLYSVGTDYSYIEVDSNPDNKDLDQIEELVNVTLIEIIIQCINEQLNLPESVLNQMKSTTALQGRQSYSNDEVTVSWTYHPDNGLEVMYSLN